MGSLRLAYCGHRWGAPAAHSCWTRSRRTQPGPASSDQSGGRQRVLRQAGDGLQRGSTGAWRQPPPLQAQRRQRELDAWGRPAPDWELPTSDAEESDADLFPEDLTPLEEEEFLLQNALAVVLLALLGLSFGNILIKLLFVTYALFSAAVRYCIIAALVVVGLVIFI